MTPEKPALEKTEWQKVIAPRWARPNSPVTISVTKKGPKSRYLTISLSAALAAKVGAEKGKLGSLYMDFAGKRLRLTTEETSDSRTFQHLGGTRISIVYPHRPFSKVLPELLLCTEVTPLAAKKGEIVFALPEKKTA